MKNFRTAVSVLLMVLAGLAGFFVGAAMNDAMGGAVLFSMIAGMEAEAKRRNDARRQQTRFCSHDYDRGR